MRCFTDDAITELAMKTVTGEAMSERDREHLDNCFGCREAFERETEIAREVARAIRTADESPTGPCLNDNDLTEYLEGSLDDADIARVERHLASCRDCIATLNGLDDLIKTADTAISPVHYVIRLANKTAEFLAKPEKGFRKSMLAYVPTLNRAGAAQDLCAWSQNVDGHPLHFRIHNGDGDRVHLTLALESSGVDPTKTTVTLRKDGNLIQSETLGNDGRVRLPGIQRGIYTFEVRSPRVLDIQIEIDLQ